MKTGKKIKYRVARLLRLAGRHPFEMISIAATISIGVWIPIAIDSGQASRARVDVCTTSILSSRHDLEGLLRGYATDRSDKPTRLADWDTALSSLEIVHVTCDSSLVSGGRLLREHPVSFEDRFAQFVKTRTSDRSGRWSDVDKGTIEAMDAWTVRAVAELSRG